jgi:hypothetical protein
LFEVFVPVAVVWPLCQAGHGHPMRPVMREGQPHWTCPESAEGAIGVGNCAPQDS